MMTFWSRDSRRYLEKNPGSFEKKTQVNSHSGAKTPGQILQDWKTFREMPKKESGFLEVGHRQIVGVSINLNQREPSDERCIFRRDL